MHLVTHRFSKHDRKNSNIGEHSILHAIKIVQSSSAVSGSSAENESPLVEQSLLNRIENLPIKGEIEENKAAKIRRVHFYVYCSTCSGIKVGKLRVCCSVCQDGAFTVSRDPCGWKDVLTPQQIPGTCEGNDCRDAFAEFFFKCAEHPYVSENDRSVVLPLLRTNTKDVSCLACTEISEVVLVFSCESSHVTCLDCFRSYCQSRLNERNFVHDPILGYTLPCPVGCTGSLIEEAHHFKVMDDVDYNRYQRFATEEFVLSAGGVLCPQPGCGMGILAERDCKRIQCQMLGCGFVFCRECLQGSHLGDCQLVANGNCESNNGNYSVNAARAAQARWEEDSETTIKIITKPCPKCRTPTERDGGCMHMQCTRSSCHYEWCWVCQTGWTRDCMGSHWFG
ncbi:E3 ubiquitin-protein ligase parkin-like isoform X3 [Artemia franciscana]|uniref:E3 ubiquitin-protein ligase parkin-like isoform X3 n=1 Tax=Artemia franciscana TaxID=6661 RepID=UPI0032DB1E85